MMECQIHDEYANATVEIIRGLCDTVSTIKLYDNEKWMSKEHKQLVENLITTCEKYLQYSIVEIGDLCQEGVDIFRDRLRQLSSQRGKTSAINNPAKAIGIQDFELIKPISKGAYGRVFLARKKATGDLYAMKVMNKRELVRKNQNQHIQAERRIMSQADNPFVVKMYYSFQSKNHLYIVMEFVNGGDIYSMLRNVGSLNEDSARVYAAELVLALTYLHDELHVIHRDLKPDNLLISKNGFIKLIDFGLSQIGVAERTAQKRDTMPTITPEKPNNQEPSNADSHADSQAASASQVNSHVASSKTSDASDGMKGVIEEEVGNTNLMKDEGELMNMEHNSQASDDNSIDSLLDKHFQHSQDASSQTSSALDDSHSLNDLSSTSMTSSSIYTSFSGSMSLNTASSTVSSISLSTYHDSISTSIGNSSLYSTASYASIVMNSSGTFTDKRGTPVKSNLKAHNGDRKDSDEEKQENGAEIRTLSKEQIKKKQAYRKLHKKKDKLSRVGTPDYMAPELLLGTYSGAANDWWSVGTIVYELMVGFPPFNDRTAELVFNRIINKDMEWPEVPADMSYEAYDFIDRLLDPNPYTRLGTKGSKEVMDHPFFQGIVWNDLQHAMYEVPFVPEVADSTDTSYFIDRYNDEKDVTASFRASLARSVDLNKSSDSGSDDNDDDVDEEAFAGFDYSNIFNLKEMNDESLGFVVKNSESDTKTSTVTSDTTSDDNTNDMTTETDGENADKQKENRLDGIDSFTPTDEDGVSTGEGYWPEEMNPMKKEEDDDVILLDSDEGGAKVEDSFISEFDVGKDDDDDGECSFVINRKNMDDLPSVYDANPYAGEFDIEGDESSDGVMVNGISEEAKRRQEETLRALQKEEEERQKAELARKEEELKKKKESRIVLNHKDLKIVIKKKKESSKSGIASEVLSENEESEDESNGVNESVMPSKNMALSVPKEYLNDFAFDFDDDSDDSDGVVVKKTLKPVLSPAHTELSFERCCSPLAKSPREMFERNKGTCSIPNLYRGDFEIDDDDEEDSCIIVHKKSNKGSMADPNEDHVVVATNPSHSTPQSEASSDKEDDLFFDVKVDEDGDYVNYVFDFQNESE